MTMDKQVYLLKVWKKSLHNSGIPGYKILCAFENFPNALTIQWYKEFYKCGNDDYVIDPIEFAKPRKENTE